MLLRKDFKIRFVDKYGLAPISVTERLWSNRKDKYGWRLMGILQGTVLAPILWNGLSDSALNLNWLDENLILIWLTAELSLRVSP